MCYELLSDEVHLDGLTSIIRHHISRLESTPFQPCRSMYARKHSLRVHLKRWLLKVISKNEDTL